MLLKFEENRNIELFDVTVFLTVFDKALTPFWRTFLKLKLLFTAELLI